jgi:hypothetical protein
MLKLDSTSQEHAGKLGLNCRDTYDLPENESALPSCRY